MSEKVAEAGAAAAASTAAMAAMAPSARALLLDAVAANLEAERGEIVDAAAAETQLGRARLETELARTTAQLRLFAGVVREGSWVDARIDTGDRDAGAPDVRRMLAPIGPVAVFGASNFPLAFAVAGGDTASALAAGNPVVVRAHPAQPQTAALTAACVRAAITRAAAPAGAFAVLIGGGHDVSRALVQHPAIRAVGFTGSLAGGRALLDAAARRPDPIPVHAEMASTNPVIVLPGATLAADVLVASITGSGGQLCTKPGLVIGHGNAFERVVEALAAGMATAPAVAMLHDGIAAAYERATGALDDRPDVQVLAKGDRTGAEGVPTLVAVDAASVIDDATLAEEIFGPAAIAVRCADEDELHAVAASLSGHLTATVWGSGDDLDARPALLATLAARAGRLVFNGVPTGVRVCAAMHHGGPWPATSDARHTSVGTAALSRFARPICWQDAPQAILPAALRDANELGIWRLVDGDFTREDIS